MISSLQRDGIDRIPGIVLTVKIAECVKNERGILNGDQILCHQEEMKGKSQ